MIATRLHCTCDSCNRAAQGEEAITAALEAVEIWRERHKLEQESRKVAEARVMALEETVGALLEGRA